VPHFTEERITAENEDYVWVEVKLVAIKILLRLENMSLIPGNVDYSRTKYRSIWNEIKDTLFLVAVFPL
jgi:hypothetical protein